MAMKKYKSKNVYLSAFLVSQDNFTLGKVWIDDLKLDNKAWITVEYDETYSGLLDNYIELYEKKRAICQLHAYQENIRFIMHLVNARKSGIEGDVE